MSQIKHSISQNSLLAITSVFLLACVVFFYKLGSFPLFNPDEALYAEPAREMLECGEYITTLLNYVVRFTKPPLCIWAMAGSYQVFGVNEFAARFFGAACGAVLVAITCGFIIRFISLRAAVPAALTLVSAPLFVGTAREAITDMPLSLFMACAQMAFFTAFESGRKSYSYIAWVLIGLAVMTKGPVAVVLPAMILFIYHGLRGDLLKALKFHNVFAGAAIVGLISLPWFVTEIIITKGAYFHEFIMRENFQRFTANVDSHKQPFWYHAAAMLGGYLPWTLFLLPAVYTFVRGAVVRLAGGLASISSAGARSIYKQINLIFDGDQPADQAQRLGLYALIWAVVTVVFFSMSVSKLLPYTLPAFPALAILVALYLQKNLDRICLVERAGDPHNTGAPLKVALPLSLPMLGMIAVYGAVAVFVPRVIGRLRDAPAGLDQYIASYACALGAITLMCLLLVRLRKANAAMHFLTVLSAIALTVYAGKILPIVSQKWEAPLVDFARFCAGDRADNAGRIPIIVFDMRKPGVPFYTRRKVENINEGHNLQARLKQLNRAYILAKIKKRDFLLTVDGVKLLRAEGDFGLFSFGRDPVPPDAPKPMPTENCSHPKGQ